MYCFTCSRLDCLTELSSIRCNPVLKAFCAGLRARNKPGKVALTAVMCRLIIQMNNKFKTLAQTPPTTKADAAKKIQKNLAK